VIDAAIVVAGPGLTGTSSSDSRLEKPRFNPDSRDPKKLRKVTSGAIVAHAEARPRLAAFQ